MHRNKNTYIFAHRTHTERTHTTHRQNNMQHIEDNREQNTENNTEQHTETDTNNLAQHQRTEHSTDNLYTYSYDLYHEQICIKNSNTIELYTISK